jgi:hypothetical protein
LAVVSSAKQLPAAAADPKAQAILKVVDKAVATGPFAATWPSLERYAAPAWYRDGKFGIFIHWGLYSVPAFGNEWYPRNMYRQGTPEFAHHVATFGPQSKFGYKDQRALARLRRTSRRVRQKVRALGSVGCVYPSPVPAGLLKVAVHIQDEVHGAG